MLGGTRDARRTERYLDELMAADQRRVTDFPVDVDMDPAVRMAAGELRADLVRVHPSFRFEEALAARLAAGAMRLRAGLHVEVATDEVATPGTLAAFRTISPATGPIEPLAVPPASGFRRFPELAARQSRPLIMGGVGVASAAISIGAVYVAWRYSHPVSGRMARAARTAHGRSPGSGRRRTGVINGILGVVS
ncbi:MAG: hypothetical protein ACXWNR_04495 [Candidatus Limnocylindrales bacterium]